MTPASRALRRARGAALEREIWAAAFPPRRLHRPRVLALVDDDHAERALEVGDLIAARRAVKVGCICGGASCVQLLSRTKRGRDDFERLLCSATRQTFRRVWIQR